MTSDLLKVVRSNIYLGELDEHLNQIIEDIQDRKKVLAREKFQELIPGTLVRFNENVRPKYLVGVPAVVVKRKQTRVVVKLGQDVGRFLKGEPISTHVNLLEIVDKPVGE